MRTQQPREYHHPHHLHTSQFHLDLVAGVDVDKEDEAVDNADEDATGVGELDSSHIPLPSTISQQGNPRHRTLEEYPPCGRGRRTWRSPRIFHAQ